MSRLTPPARRALVLGTCVGLVGLTAFAGIAAAVSTPDSAVVALDWRVAHAAQQATQDEPVLLNLARFVTHLGGVPVMIGVNVVGVFTMLFLRQWRLALAWAVVSGTGGLGNVVIKGFFDRTRPGQTQAGLADTAVVETNESFPSGHAMGATIGYGALGYTLCVLLRRRRWAIALATGLVVLVVAICATRVYLRAHWLSDVIAGSAVGVCWLAACLTPAEVARRGHPVGSDVA